jgi:hypothetical protein
MGYGLQHGAEVKQFFNGAGSKKYFLRYNAYTKKKRNRASATF